MGKNKQTLPKARTNNLVTRDMPNEVLVYDLQTHKAHCLNQTAATIWSYCDGETSVMDIAQMIAQEQQTAFDEAAGWLAVEKLSQANLLEEPVEPPAGSPRLGRRAALKRLGTAVAVPIVMSVLAPTAQAACTGPFGIGSPCAANCQCGSGCCKAGTCQNLAVANAPCTNDASCCSGNCSNGNPKKCIG